MDVDALCKTVAEATTTSLQLPGPADFAFHATSPAFRHRASLQSGRLIDLIEGLLKKVDPAISWHGPGSEEIDDDERMEQVVEVTDGLLERVDVALDTARAAATADAMRPAAPTNVAVQSRFSGRSVRVVHANNIRRPQLSFKDKVDNSVGSIFVPKIRHKPNAIEPLDLEPIRTDHAAGIPEAVALHIAGMGMASPPTVSYRHPYQPELDAYEPVESQLTKVQVEKPRFSIEDCPAVWVDDVEGLMALKQALDAVTEFAVDLEAHNYRTYVSFACLMQVSTRTHDYLVDVLALRSEVHVLNSSFTNPRIVKVLHGADSDIVWLQKDLGLYIVNLFDTGQAARVLEFPRFSLAYLLKEYCGIVADKTHQLSDWRIRPLTAEMARYAQEDTHSLLYIYDEIRNMLVDRGNEQSNLLRAVWMRSRDLCATRYEKPLSDPDAYLALYTRNSRSLNALQLEIFRRLHAWRDQVAREEDESIRYVMPDHMLFDLADVCPREASQVVACCTPTPPLVRMNAHVIVDVVSEAVEASSAGERSNGSSYLKAQPSSAQSSAPMSVDEPTGSGKPSSYGVLEDLPKPYDVTPWLCSEETASALARTLASQSSSNIDHESFAKAVDVRRAFGSLSLFGDFGRPLRDLPRQNTSNTASSTTVVPETPDATQSVTPREDQEIVHLSKMRRTGGPAKRTPKHT